MSEDKALSMIVETKLSKYQYNVIRPTAKECSSKIFPSYDVISKAKNQVITIENITIIETSAEVKFSQTTKSRLNNLY